MKLRLTHRGPDDSGEYASQEFGVVHTRLSIIDLEDGAQPMLSNDGTVCLAFNGEIYNYLELRKEFSQRGYRFRTESDTEVILAAYQIMGADFVSHLNGMFAFALWDQSQQSLMLCRDRFGIKPLFWCKTSEGMAFASEIHALRALPGCANEIDPRHIDEYFSCGYVAAPNSLLKGVKKVPVATALTINANDIQSTQYWTLGFNPDYDTTAGEWTEQIRDCVANAIKLQLRSDVPVGTFLSGGLDSTLISSAAVRQLGDRRALKSFCIGVDSKDFPNEFRWAKQVAETLGLDHQEFRLSPDSYGGWFKQACQSLGEPVAEPMLGQLLALSQYTREHVKVVLSGEGADEFWLGYPIYRILGALEAPQAVLPAGLLKLLGAGLLSLSKMPGVPPRFRKYSRLFNEPVDKRYRGLNFLDNDIKKRILSADLAGNNHDAEYSQRYFSASGGPESHSRLAAVDCQTWLVDNTLMRSDQLSMAKGLELRVPFLDNHLVDLACKIPAKLKIKGGQQKAILKEAFSKRVPKAVADRAKVGFPTPLSQLFRASWGREIGPLLFDGYLANGKLTNQHFVESMYHEHSNGTRNWSRELLRVVAFEYWAETITSD